MWLKQTTVWSFSNHLSHLARSRLTRLLVDIIHASVTNLWLFWMHATLLYLQNGLTSTGKIFQGRQKQDAAFCYQTGDNKIYNINVATDITNSNSQQDCNMDIVNATVIDIMACCMHLTQLTKINLLTCCTDIVFWTMTMLNLESKIIGLGDMSLAIMYL